MRRFFTILLIVIVTGTSMSLNAQKATNSVYINFGRSGCDSSYSGSDYSLIGDAQSVSPINLINCNTNSTIGNIFSKFISYNALNNKIYINDISDGVNSKIYILNIGLPSNITCPTISAPSYTIPGVILNQFEFDPLGDLYAISNYSAATGLGQIGAYDDTTGALIVGSLKTLVFPSGHFPHDVSNGDIAIMPNGRLFAVFGGDTSKFFEITNYKKTVSGNAVATYLGTPARVCYGLAYDNGYMIMAGTTLGGYCYCYVYDINSNSLGSETASPLNCMPIDNASFTPSVGASEKLVASTQVSANVYDLVYQVCIQNKGNVKVGNVQTTLDLAGTFGSATISNVTTSWINNGANLNLNASFNGTSDTKLLQNANQSIVNTPASKTSSKIQVNVRVSNAVPAFIYYSSAIITAKVGSGAKLLQLRDSSNNYIASYNSWNSAVDPDNNNVSDDANEGVPTPWQMGIALPVELESFAADAQDASVLLSWNTSAEINTHHFCVQRSLDGVKFDSIGNVTALGTSTENHTYFFTDKNPEATVLYYRLRQVTTGGAVSYSPTREVEMVLPSALYNVYPNPAADYVVIDNAGKPDDVLHVQLFNIYGKMVYSTDVNNPQARYQAVLPRLDNGYYSLIVSGTAHTAQFFKIFINR